MPSLPPIYLEVSLRALANWLKARLPFKVADTRQPIIYAFYGAEERHGRREQLWIHLGFRRQSPDWAGVADRYIFEPVLGVAPSVFNLEEQPDNRIGLTIDWPDNFDRAPLRELLVALADKWPEVRASEAYQMIVAESGGGPEPSAGASSHSEPVLDDVRWPLRRSVNDSYQDLSIREDSAQRLPSPPLVKHRPSTATIEDIFAWIRKQNDRSPLIQKCADNFATSRTTIWTLCRENGIHGWKDCLRQAWEHSNK
jgi:hypothetical protein